MVEGKNADDDHNKKRKSTSVAGVLSHRMAYIQLTVYGNAVPCIMLIRKSGCRPTTVAQ